MRLEKVPCPLDIVYYARMRDENDFIEAQLLHSLHSPARLVRRANQRDMGEPCELRGFGSIVQINCNIREHRPGTAR